MLLLTSLTEDGLQLSRVLLFENSLLIGCYTFLTDDVFAAGLVSFPDRREVRATLDTGERAEYELEVSLVS